MFDGRQPAAIKCKRSSSLRSRSVRAGVGRRWRVCSQSSVGSDSDLELELVQRCERFDCFVGCLVECFVGCLVECFVRCLVECFVRCRPVGYRENVSMLHMSISLSGFVGPSCFFLPPDRFLHKSLRPFAAWLPKSTPTEKFTWRQPLDSTPHLLELQRSPLAALPRT